MKSDNLFHPYQRQIHLDFHTSPFIPDVGKDFDAKAFAKTMKDAHVNSVTVFGKCHHGQCYYPTKQGVSHPAIGNRDLLGEQIEALHREGIRAPIYTTIVWEEDVAFRFPHWRQMRKDGRVADWEVGPDGQPGHVGTWKFNDFLNAEYQDYFEAHLREILERYGKEVDGFFLDILFCCPGSGWSDACRALRAKHGLLEDTQVNFDRFQGLAQEAFSKRFTKFIHGIKKDATVFYNAGNDGNMHTDIGPRMRADHMTHFEIESLPSGFWGYFHFPRMARAQSRWGKPWLGMTGRFQKMWGDFGGIKPQPALEFECFRAQALLGANSVGDQLPPRGILDPAAYELIGAVYKQVEEAEPFYTDASFLKPQVGIFSASYAGHDGGHSEEGAVLLCEESHYDCVVLDEKDSLKDFELLILPDTMVVSPAVAKKLKAFHARGGKLLISGRGGCDENGKWALDFLPLSFGEDEELYPSFWRAKKTFAADMSNSDRVFYRQGRCLKKSKALKVLVDRVLPYFKRSDIAYSSHFQTPPVEKADKHPAVVAGEGFIYFADPIFEEYRVAGNLAVHDVWLRCMESLIGEAPFGKGLPQGVIMYPLRRGKDLLLTLLHYVPVRKAMEIDVISERTTFAGESLKLAGKVKEVRDYSSGESLERLEDGSFRLPAVKGRLLLEIPGYY